MTDAYRLLGVDRNATDDDIKAAYRRELQRYSADNYADNPLRELAADRTRQLQEAFDAIMKERRSRPRRVAENAAGAADNADYGAGRDAAGSQDSRLRAVRELQMQNRFGEAEAMLDDIPQELRGAEWLFLRGRCFYMRGWLVEAERCFREALERDPGNAEYRAAYENLQMGARGQRGNSAAAGCSPCDLCTALICADCLCDAGRGCC